MWIRLVLRSFFFCCSSFHRLTLFLTFIFPWRNLSIAQYIRFFFSAQSLSGRWSGGKKSCWKSDVTVSVPTWEWGKGLGEGKAELAKLTLEKSGLSFFLSPPLFWYPTHCPCSHGSGIAWAPDSWQLYGLWGSYRWAKPDALSLGSRLHTVPLLALPTQAVRWAPYTDTP